MADWSLAVRGDGLRDLRRVLRKANIDLDKGLAVAMRRTGKVVRDRARVNAPIGPDRDPHRGALKRSLRYSVTQKKASIYSNDPKAPVHEYGGTIRPRGVPIQIPRRRYVGRAIKQSRREIDAMTEGLLDAIAEEFGHGGMTP